MKRLMVKASLCFLLCVAPPSYVPGQTLSGPSMVLPERSFDFKNVMQGKIVAHGFSVLNKGNQVLEIRNVNPG